MRANQYELYCQADPLFYDIEQPGGDPSPANPDFALSRREAPQGWHRSEVDDWVSYTPDSVDLPSQGWKIHVSACSTNMEKILQVVWDHCVSRQLAFKFLRSPHWFFMRNAKPAARGYSGKLVTIYPVDVVQMELVCKELDGLLGGEPSPYVLSDLRWGDGPVFVRYGGFEERRCRASSGELVAAIEDGDGRLVPDERPPAFTLPPWVELPGCLQPHLAARNAVTTGDLPYTIDKALLFSNGGGVYLGRHTDDGRPVVLKEARPHAGLTGDGADAVTRLHREHDVLVQLAGIEGVPAVHDLTTVGEHLFLVMERLDGSPLNREIVRRHPGLGIVDDPAEAAAYARWAVDVFGKVERLVASIHRRGVAHGDLHPRNLLVTDDQVGLVDFEVAHDIGSPRRQQLAAPGYGAPDGRTGRAVDEYALACLRFGLFVPLTQLFRFTPQKAGQLADVIAERFPVDRAWLDEAVAVVTAGVPALCSVPGWRAGEPGGWPTTRSQLAEAIIASATPARDDRLFPGDIAQFRTGGANMAHGAAGVLWALSVTGAGRFPRYEEWLLDRATRPAAEPQLGFYDGYHGIAYALDHLGHRDAALDLVELCLAEPSDRCGHDLRSGLAGIGLNLLHLAGTTGESQLRNAAERAAQVLADRLDGFDDGSTLSGGVHPHAGLMRGWTGPGLLFLHLFEATGDTTFLDRAAAALRADLQRCTVRDDDGGTMQVNEGWRTMPYLDVGSVGIGLVLDRYLTHRHDQQFAEASAAIHGAACAWFYIEPGLFSGRAGMVYYLATRRRSVAAATEQMHQQVAGLAWHALGLGEGIAFPGEHLLRLSMDLASGTAGVLVALGAAHGEQPVHLPFLAPPLPSS